MRCSICCEVYVPMLFQKKVIKNWCYGPGLILRQLLLMGNLNTDIQDILMPCTKSDTLNAHAEHIILQIMITRDDKAKRVFCQTNKEHLWAK